MAIQFGDTSGVLKGHQRGGNQNLSGATHEENTTVGDASELSGHAIGGDDILSGGFFSASEFIVGDAFRASGNARGGDDKITGAIQSGDQWLYGDVSEDLRGHASGGNDSIYGGGIDNLNVYIFGDAYRAWNNVSSGDDILRGGTYALNNFIFGDALELHDKASGGNDVVMGGTLSFNRLYGDAKILSDNASGGDDRLIGSDWIDWMWGDAETVSGSATMGHDTFVFQDSGFIGFDIIFDFRPGEDIIELDGFTAQAFEDLNVSQLDFDHDGSADSSLIDFGIFSSISVVGVTQLTASDFVFA